MRRIYLYIWVITLVMAALITLPSSRRATAQTLEGNEFLRTQAESDFDGDGDIDFLDFTVFSAFYDEGT